MTGGKFNIFCFSDKMVITRWNCTTKISSAVKYMNLNLHCRWLRAKWSSLDSLCKVVHDPVSKNPSLRLLILMGVSYIFKDCSLLREHNQHIKIPPSTH
jgi:hypothetical protein